MKLLKPLLLSAIVIGSLSNPLYAETTKTMPSMTPAEIGTLATVATIDKTEIIAAVVAMNKHVHDDVIEFAKMMIDQHGNNLTEILTLVNNKYSLSGGQSEKLAAEGTKELMKLGAMQSNDFATAYVDAMVKGHEAALNLIDQHLMKTAKSDEVKKFLTDTRAAVAKHLEHAKKLQEKMKS